MYAKLELKLFRAPESKSLDRGVLTSGTFCLLNVT